MFPETQWKNISTNTNLWQSKICESTRFRQASKWPKRFWNRVQETVNLPAKHTIISGSNVKAHGLANLFATPTMLPTSVLECTILWKILSKIILNFWHTDLITKNFSR